LRWRETNDASERRAELSRTGEASRKSSVGERSTWMRGSWCCCQTTPKSIAP